MTEPRKHADFMHQGRQDRLLRERVHDTYKSKHKLPEPTECPQCGAIYHEGRWTWGAASATAHRELCPACHRINDHVPAGFLTLNGEFLQQHRDEILHVIRNVEAKEKAEHPLNRLMRIEDQDEGGVLVTFTNPHLARAAGEAVQSAYKGEFELDYEPDETIVRVRWSR